MPSTALEELAKGAWVKGGKASTNALAPGSFSGYLKIRAKPTVHTKTAQQKKIAEAGRRVGLECKGLRGQEFTTCRTKALSDIRKPAEHVH